MFLVVAPGSPIGNMVAQSLRAAQQQVRILAGPFAPDAAGADGIRLVRGDISDNEGLRQVLDGVSTLLLNTHIPNRRPSEQLKLVQLAAECGVRQLVTLGFKTPRLCLPLLLDVWQQELRRSCQASGMLVTHLWTSCPMQVILPMAEIIASHGVFRTPLLKGRHPVVDQRDVAAATVAVMLNPALAGRQYLLTGPAAVCAADVACALSDVLGRSITYAPVSPAQTRAEESEAGWLAEQVDAMLELLEAIEYGYVSEVSLDMEALIGRPGRSVREFLLEHQALFERPESSDAGDPQIQPCSA